MPRETGSRRHVAPPRAAIAESAGNAMTRKHVAERLGVSETSVRRLEGTRLHPVHRGRFVYFDEHEVESYASERSPGRPSGNPGEIAAHAFELFREGKGFRDVVIELRQTPERVRQLYREYALGSDLLLPAAILRAIEELGFGEEGRALGAQDVLHLIHSLAEGNRRLVQKTIDQAQQIEQLGRALARIDRHGPISADIPEGAARTERDSASPASAPTEGQ
jgi:hypothetical protein